MLNVRTVQTNIMCNGFCYMKKKTEKRSRQTLTVSLTVLAFEHIPEVREWQTLQAS